MLPPAERSQKPFGTRRPAAESDRPVPAHPGPSRTARPTGSLAWALRISAVVGLLALAATHQLARLSQAGPAPGQLALAGHGLPADPETTGSLAPAGAARATRLDPCLLPALDRHQP
ncbi:MULTISPECIES: hypothetical protein [unclassified Methylobacterium]|uniref:hypothetical protein n=1 Tax=unclassified Methylobacterium TaxID=2615210 RepID=UPI0011C1FF96|nr:MULTISPECIES: hypothetical protein [unclassified Methylobacterium]QEE39422.1 hypothetical protein FVA80_11215 [Methylobacterium sp. WL1]TXN56994.1 hypothetical protein FV241_13065 [Methylobacterium sp. WL2]